MSGRSAAGTAIGHGHSNGQRVLMRPVYPPVMDLFVPPHPPHRCLLGILECGGGGGGGGVGAGGAFHSLFANLAIYSDEGMKSSAQPQPESLTPCPQRSGKIYSGFGSRRAAGGT